MKKRHLFMVLSSACLVLMMAILPFITACAKPAPAPAPSPAPAPKPTPTPAPAPPAGPPPVEVRELTVVSLEPRDDVQITQRFVLWEEAVNKRCESLKLKYLGGPEVIPPPQQAEAVSKGAIDIYWGFATMFAGFGAAFNTGTVPYYSISEAREFILPIVNDAFAELANCRAIGNFGELPPRFRIGVNKKISDPKTEFAGLKIRGLPFWHPGIEAVGAKPMYLPLPEVYTALERGVVDGIFAPGNVFSKNAWYEVLDYIVGPPTLVGGADSWAVINLDVWNSLSEEQQNCLEQTMIELEPEMARIHQEEIRYGPTSDTKLVEEYGMEEIRWSKEDEDWLRDTIHGAIWKDCLEKDPVYTPRIKAWWDKRVAERGWPTEMEMYGWVSGGGPK